VASLVAMTAFFSAFYSPNQEPTLHKDSSKMLAISSYFN